MVYNKAIHRITRDNLRVFVIWTPRYPGDNRGKAAAATRIVPDSRSTHYWDVGGVLPKTFGRVLNLPEGEQFAWDTYMIFGPDSQWEQVPPKPNHWMHQMGSTLGRKHPRWLDAEQFRESIQSLIE